MLEKPAKRYRRHKRVRAKISGTAKVPRLCVFRSAKHIYGQLIDDTRRQTLTEASDLELGDKAKRQKEAKSKKIHPVKSSKEGGIPSKTELFNGVKKENEEKAQTKKAAVAFAVGKLIAEKALKKKIEKVVFDRGGYKYHGRVKALAEGVREGGLKF